LYVVPVHQLQQSINRQLLAPVERTQMGVNVDVLVLAPGRDCAPAQTGSRRGRQKHTTRECGHKKVSISTPLLTTYGPAAPHRARSGGTQASAQAAVAAPSPPPPGSPRWSVGFCTRKVEPPFFAPTELVSVERRLLHKQQSQRLHRPHRARPGGAQASCHCTAPRSYSPKVPTKPPN